jgi:hypothetical protein
MERRGSVTPLKKTTLLACLLLASCESGPLLPLREPVTSVEVSSPAPSVAVGGTIQLTATPRGRRGDPLSGRSVEWASLREDLATVSELGLVTAHAPGVARIQATSESKVGEVDLVVDPPPVSRVGISPPGNFTLVQGTTRQLTGRAFAADDSELMDRFVEWTSSDHAVAVVSVTGLVEARGPGFASITATVEGKTASVQVDVPAWFEAPLTRVNGGTLPAVWISFEFTDQNNVRLNRTLRIVSGSVRLNLQAGIYEQRATVERWEDTYVIVNGQPVFTGIQLKETQLFEDAGTAGPMHSGVDLLVFTSTVLPGHTFTGYRSQGTLEVTERLNATGPVIGLRFGN